MATTGLLIEFENTDRAHEHCTICQGCLYAADVVEVGKNLVDQTWYRHPEGSEDCIPEWDEYYSDLVGIDE